jgi:ATP-dependent Lon protease
MTHPTREEWMSFLYDELPPDARVALQTHLDACGDCRAQMDTWQTATQQMSEWKLPPKRRRAAAQTLTRWAIAASIAGLGVIGGGRLVSLNNEVKQLRTEVHQQLIEEVRRDLNSTLAQVTEQATKSATTEAQALIAAVAQKLEEKRLTDQQATLAALQQMSAQHVTDYASMRKELETVAVFTETGLQRAQSQIATLADSPAGLSDNK